MGLPLLFGTISKDCAVLLWPVCGFNCIELIKFKGNDKSGMGLSIGLGSAL